MSRGSSQSAPTLSQVVAMAYTYRRIVIVWGVGPLIALFLPFVNALLRLILNGLTSGYGMLSIMLTVLCTTASYRLIQNLPSASSRKEIEEGLAKNEFRLPIVIFMASSTFSRYVLGPLIDWIGLPLGGLPQLISFASGLRISMAMLLLGLSVVLRYVFPKSIMRCSAFPLISNPFESYLRYLWEKGFSFLIEPTNNYENETMSSFWENDRGRRFQRPTFSAGFAQILLSGGFGYVATVFELVAAPHAGAEDYCRSINIGACILVTLTCLLSVLDGVSHEIDPRRYIRLPDGWASSFSQHVLKRVCVAVIFAPPLAIALFHYFSEDIHVSLELYRELVVNCMCTVIYLLVLDEAIKFTLFNARVDLKQLVDEIHFDSTPVTRLDVMLRSLLSDATLVQEVWSPTQKPHVLDLLQEEASRTEELAKKTAKVFLSRSASYAEAPLEEDILRVTVLEAFGGVAPSNPPTNPRAGQPSRHQAVIEEWFDWNLTKVESKCEPLVVPLVRALCAFAGGLGEALLVVCSPKPPACLFQKPPEQQQQSPRITESWKMSPGALACADFAITGASRCIVRGLTTSGRPRADWKSSHLSMLVPAALAAAFRLRAGVSQYAEQLGKTNNSISIMESKAGTGWQTGTHNPELMSLMYTCDKTAIAILHVLKSQHSVDLPLDNECLAWIDQLSKRKTVNERIVALVNSTKDKIL